MYNTIQYNIYISFFLGAIFIDGDESAAQVSMLQNFFCAIINFHLNLTFEGKVVAFLEGWTLRRPTQWISTTATIKD
jgi:hypothetical protein